MKGSKGRKREVMKKEGKEELIMKREVGRKGMRSRDGNTLFSLPLSPWWHEGESGKRVKEKDDKILPFPPYA